MPSLGTFRQIFLITCKIIANFYPTLPLVSGFAISINASRAYSVLCLLGINYYLPSFKCQWSFRRFDDKVDLELKICFISWWMKNSFSLEMLALNSFVSSSFLERWRQLSLLALLYPCRNICSSCLYVFHRWREDGVSSSIFLFFFFNKLC